MRAAALVCVYLAVAVFASCEDSLASEFALQNGVGSAQFGDDGALAVSAEPGRHLDSVENTATDVVTALWAGGPTPVLRIDNGTDNSNRIAVVDATLFNVPADMIANAYVGELSDGAVAQPGCQTLDDPVLTTVFPNVLDRSADTGAPTFQHTFAVDHCSTLRLVAQLTERQQDRYRLAIAGPTAADESFLERLAREAGTDGWDADYVQFTGDIAQSDDADPFARFLTNVCPGYPTCTGGLGVPFGVAMGTEDRLAGIEAFINRFGQTTFLSQVGAVRYLVIDSASGGLTDGQFELIADIPRGGPPGIVVMHVPPFSPHRLSNRGLRSTQEAARLVELLLDRNFQWVFSGADETFRVGTFSDLQIWDTPGAQGDGDSYLRVVVNNAEPALPVCDAATPCAEGQLCVGGFCRQRCTSSDQCDAVRSVCEPRTSTCRAPCETVEDCPWPGSRCETDRAICNEQPWLDVSSIPL